MVLFVTLEKPLHWEIENSHGWALHSMLWLTSWGPSGATWNHLKGWKIYSLFLLLSFLYLVIKTILLYYLLSCFFYWNLKTVLSFCPPGRGHAGRCQVENYRINDATVDIYEIFHYSCHVHTDCLFLYVTVASEILLWGKRCFCFPKLGEEQWQKISWNCQFKFRCLIYYF